MENFFLQIKDIVFRLKLDAEIAVQMLGRVPALSNSISQSNYNVDVICTKVEKINFTDDKFLNQQEPDIDNDIFYREIFDVGTFKYYRKQKILSIFYFYSLTYPYNCYEAVVDTILQFIYLILLDYNVVPLHASCVINNNKPILIFGNSGSGKTTLQLSLLCLGLSFFSDDICFIDENLLIYNSGEKIISCTQATTNIINSLFKQNIQGAFINDHHKHVLRADKMFDDFKINLQPHIILFPQISDIDDYEMRLIDKKEAYIRLIQYSISQKFSVNEKIKYFSALKDISNLSTPYIINRGKCPNTSKFVDICEKIMCL